MSTLADEITVAYTSNRALDAVTSRLATGRIHALAGQHGPGKSTLINISAGGLTPQGGRVLLVCEPRPLLHPAFSQTFSVTYCTVPRAGEHTTQILRARPAAATTESSR